MNEGSSAAREEHTPSTALEWMHTVREVDDCFLRSLLHVHLSRPHIPKCPQLALDSPADEFRSFAFPTSMNLSTPMESDLLCHTEEEVVPTHSGSNTRRRSLSSPPPLPLCSSPEMSSGSSREVVGASEDAHVSELYPATSHVDDAMEPSASTTQAPAAPGISSTPLRSPRHGTIRPLSVDERQTYAGGWPSLVLQYAVVRQHLYMKGSPPYSHSWSRTSVPPLLAERPPSHASEEELSTLVDHLAQDLEVDLVEPPDVSSSSAGATPSILVPSLLQHWWRSPCGGSSARRRTQRPGWMLREWVAQWSPAVDKLPSELTSIIPQQSFVEKLRAVLRLPCVAGSPPPDVSWAQPLVVGILRRFDDTTAQHGAAAPGLKLRLLPPEETLEWREAVLAESGEASLPPSPTGGAAPTPTAPDTPHTFHAIIYELTGSEDAGLEVSVDGSLPTRSAESLSSDGVGYWQRLIPLAHFVHVLGTRAQVERTAQYVSAAVKAKRQERSMGRGGTVEPSLSQLVEPTSALAFFFTLAEGAEEVAFSSPSSPLSIPSPLRSSPTTRLAPASVRCPTANNNTMDAAQVEWSEWMYRHLLPVFMEVDGEQSKQQRGKHGALPPPQTKSKTVLLCRVQHITPELFTSAHTLDSSSFRAAKHPEFVAGHSETATPPRVKESALIQHILLRQLFFQPSSGDATMSASSPTSAPSSVSGGVEANATTSVATPEPSTLTEVRQLPTKEPTTRPKAPASPIGAVSASNRRVSFNEGLIVQLPEEDDGVESHIPDPSRPTIPGQDEADETDPSTSTASTAATSNDPSTCSPLSAQSPKKVLSSTLSSSLSVPAPKSILKSGRRYKVERLIRESASTRSVVPFRNAFVWKATMAESWSKDGVPSTLITGRRDASPRGDASRAVAITSRAYLSLVKELGVRFAYQVALLLTLSDFAAGEDSTCAGSDLVSFRSDLLHLVSDFAMCFMRAALAPFLVGGADQDGGMVETERRLSIRGIAVAAASAGLPPITLLASPSALTPRLSPLALQRGQVVAYALLVEVQQRIVEHTWASVLSILRGLSCALTTAQWKSFIITPSNPQPSPSMCTFHSLASPAGPNSATTKPSLMPESWEQGDDEDDGSEVGEESALSLHDSPGSKMEGAPLSTRTRWGGFGVGAASHNEDPLHEGNGSTPLQQLRQLADLCNELLTKEWTTSSASGFSSTSEEISGSGDERALVVRATRDAVMECRWALFQTYFVRELYPEWVSLLQQASGRRASGCPRGDGVGSALDSSFRTGDFNGSHEEDSASRRLGGSRDGDESEIRSPSSQGRHAQRLARQLKAARAISSEIAERCRVLIEFFPVREGTQPSRAFSPMRPTFLRSIGDGAQLTPPRSSSPADVVCGETGERIAFSASVRLSESNRIDVDAADDEQTTGSTLTSSGPAPSRGLPKLPSLDSTGFENNSAPAPTSPPNGISGNPPLGYPNVAEDIRRVSELAGRLLGLLWHEGEEETSRECSRAFHDAQNPFVTSTGSLPHPRPRRGSMDTGAASEVFAPLGPWRANSFTGSMAPTSLCSFHMSSPSPIFSGMSLTSLRGGRSQPGNFVVSSMADSFNGSAIHGRRLLQSMGEDHVGHPVSVSGAPHFTDVPPDASAGGMSASSAVGSPLSLIKVPPPPFDREARGSPHASGGYSPRRGTSYPSMMPSFGSPSELPEPVNQESATAAHPDAVGASESAVLGSSAINMNAGGPLQLGGAMELSSVSHDEYGIFPHAEASLTSKPVSYQQELPGVMIHRCGVASPTSSSTLNMRSNPAADSATSATSSLGDGMLNGVGGTQPSHSPPNPFCRRFSFPLGLIDYGDRDDGRAAGRRGSLPSFPAELLLPRAATPTRRRTTVMDHSPPSSTKNGSAAVSALADLQGQLREALAEVDLLSIHYAEAQRLLLEQSEEHERWKLQHASLGEVLELQCGVTPSSGEGPTMADQRGHKTWYEMRISSLEEELERYRMMMQSSPLAHPPPPFVETDQNDTVAPQSEHPSFAEAPEHVEMEKMESREVSPSPSAIHPLTGMQTDSRDALPDLPPTLADYPTALVEHCAEEGLPARVAQLEAELQSAHFQLRQWQHLVQTERATRATQVDHLERRLRSLSASPSMSSRSVSPSAKDVELQEAQRERLEELSARILALEAERDGAVATLRDAQHTSSGTIATLEADKEVLAHRVALVQGEQAKLRSQNESLRAALFDALTAHVTEEKNDQLRVALLENKCADVEHQRHLSEMMAREAITMVSHSTHQILAETLLSWSAELSAAWLGNMADRKKMIDVHEEAVQGGQRERHESWRDAVEELLLAHATEVVELRLEVHSGWLTQTHAEGLLQAHVCERPAEDAADLVCPVMEPLPKPPPASTTRRPDVVESLPRIGTTTPDGLRSTPTLQADTPSAAALLPRNDGGVLDEGGRRGADIEEVLETHESVMTSMAAQLSDIVESLQQGQEEHGSLRLLVAQLQAQLCGPVDHTEGGTANLPSSEASSVRYQQPHLAWISAMMDSWHHFQQRRMEEESDWALQKQKLVADAILEVLQLALTSSLSRSPTHTSAAVVGNAVVASTQTIQKQAMRMERGVQERPLMLAASTSTRSPMHATAYTQTRAATRHHQSSQTAPTTTTTKSRAEEAAFLLDDPMALRHELQGKRQHVARLQTVVHELEHLRSLDQRTIQSLQSSLNMYEDVRQKAGTSSALQLWPMEPLDELNRQPKPKSTPTNHPMPAGDGGTMTNTPLIQRSPAIMSSLALASKTALESLAAPPTLGIPTTQAATTTTTPNSSAIRGAHGTPVSPYFDRYQQIKNSL